MAAGAAMIVCGSSASADGYAAFLAAECARCHLSKPGQSEAAEAAALSGMTAEAFTLAMRGYQTGARENILMRDISRSLDDADLAALAVYFAAQETPRP